MSTDRDTGRGIVLVALTKDGAALARKVQGAIPKSRIHGLAGRVEDCDTAFTDTTAHLADLFAAGHVLENEA